MTFTSTYPLPPSLFHPTHSIIIRIDPIGYSLADTFPSSRYLLPTDATIFQRSGSFFPFRTLSIHCVEYIRHEYGTFPKKNRKKQEFNFPLGKVFSYFQFRSYFVLCRESILEDRLSFALFTQTVLTRRRKDPVDRPKRILLNRLSQL